MQRARRCMLHAACSLEHAACNMQRATCSVQRAPCDVCVQAYLASAEAQDRRDEVKMLRKSEKELLVEIAQVCTRPGRRRVGERESACSPACVELAGGGGAGDVRMCVRVPGAGGGQGLEWVWLTMASVDLAVGRAVAIRRALEGS